MSFLARALRQRPLNLRNLGDELRRRLWAYPARPLLLKVLLFSAALRLLLVLTYPLNTGGFDASSYVHYILIPGRSNLLHSSAAIYLLDWWTWLLPPGGFRTQAALDFLLLGQHMLELVATAAFAIAAIGIFGRAIGAIATLLYASNPLVLSFSSMVHPQSLQASLFTIAWSFSYFGWREAHPMGKRWFYAIAGLTLSWAVLIRFSTIFLSPLVIMFFVMDRSPSKWRCIRVLVVACMLTALPYVLFHRATTGTFALSYEKSWVLTAKLRRDVGNDAVNPNNGVNSKRFLALSAVLPGDLKGVGPHTFARIDAVPAAEREKWRTAYGWLLNADEAQLGQFIDDHPLPENYELAYASTTISWYIGLAEADQLGTKVYLEWCRANPGLFWRLMIRNTWAGLTRLPSGSLMPIMPVSDYGIEQGAPSSQLGFARFTDLVPRSDNRFGADPMIIWLPGLLFFTALSALAPPGPLLAGLAAIGLVDAAIRLALRDVAASASAWLFAVGGSILLNAVLVSFVYFMRAQEARIVLPFIALLSAAGLVAMARAAAAGLSMIRGRDITMG